MRNNNDKSLESSLESERKTRVVLSLNSLFNSKKTNMKNNITVQDKIQESYLNIEHLNCHDSDNDEQKENESMNLSRFHEVIYDNAIFHSSV